MEQAPLTDSALKVIFCDNDVENGGHSKSSRGLIASEDLEIAYTIAQALCIDDLDHSLDRTANSLEHRGFSAFYDPVEIVKAINRLRQSQGITHLIPEQIFGHFNKTIQTLTGHKRKHHELLDRTEREARLRQATQRATETFEREKRARRRDGFKRLEIELEQKNQELTTAQSSLRRERTEAQRLEQSLQCQICLSEQCDTVTKCGHVFCGGCIRQWLDESSDFEEDEYGVLSILPSRCPTCREDLCEKDFNRVYL